MHFSEICNIIYSTKCCLTYRFLQAVFIIAIYNIQRKETTEYTEYAVKKVIEFKGSLFKSNVNAFS